MSDVKEKNEIKHVTKEQLVKVLMSLVGSTFATIVSETDVKMNKKNNPYYGTITKLTRANVNINFIYANAVNNARLKEGKEADFVPQARKWGEKVPGTPLVLHEGKYYLECRFLGYEKTKSIYFHNTDTGSALIEKSIIEEYLPKVSESKTQDLENEIVLRSFKIESIREVFVNKIHYTVD